VPPTTASGRAQQGLGDGARLAEDDRTVDAAEAVEVAVLPDDPVGEALHGLGLYDAAQHDLVAQRLVVRRQAHQREVGQLAVALD
jgi:hypothetical protein